VPAVAYLVGAVPTLSAAFTRRSNGNAVDPTTVTFNIRQPDETYIEYVYSVDAELIRDGVGLYHVDFTVDQAGEYCYGFVGAGDVNALAEKTFEVEDRCSVAP
jgi:uncharacterized protein YfaS (alpha-2-macroglobulin family)